MLIKISLMIFVIVSCNLSNTEDFSNNGCFVAFLSKVLPETLFKEGTIIRLVWKHLD